MFRCLTNANKSGQSNEYLIESQSCDLTLIGLTNATMLSVPRINQLNPSHVTSVGFVLEEHIGTCNFCHFDCHFYCIFWNKLSKHNNFGVSTVQ
jgi:hypothetical protein